MTSLSGKKLVAIVLVTIAVVGISLYIGCSREEPVATPEQPAEFSRLQDPEYRARLEETASARNSYMRTRARLVEQMEAKLSAAAARHGFDYEKGLTPEQDAILKPELELDPEWNSLYSRVVDLEKANQEELARARAIVRERMLQEEATGQ